MDVCLLQRILSYLLKASIDSPFLLFMSFSVSKMLPRYFMPFQSSLPYSVFVLSVSCYISNIVSILKINAEIFFILAVMCFGLVW